MSLEVLCGSTIISMSCIKHLLFILEKQHMSGLFYYRRIITKSITSASSFLLFLIDIFCINSVKINPPFMEMCLFCKNGKQRKVWIKIILYSCLIFATT